MSHLIFPFPLGIDRLGRAISGGLGGFASGLGDMVVRLFTNDVVPRVGTSLMPGTLLTDLTEATFGGYAPITPVFWSNENFSSTRVRLELRPIPAWFPDGSGLPQTLFGFYITNTFFGGPAELLCLQRFPDGPQVITGVGGISPFTCRLEIGNEFTT